MIDMKYASKKNLCEKILTKSEISSIDIIDIEKIIFSGTINPNEKENQKFRSYDEKSIIKILKYQKENKLSNVDVSIYFKISRNTLAKWKKIYSLL